MLSYYSFSYQNIKSAAVLIALTLFVLKSLVEWYNYQKDIMDSGALGKSGGGGGGGGGGDLNPDSGDYKGF